MTDTPLPKYLTNGWLNTVTAVAQVGFTTWFAWYLITTALPAIQAQFSKDLELQRLAFIAALKEDKEDTREIVNLTNAGSVVLLERIDKTVAEVLQIQREEIALAKARAEVARP